MATYSFKTQQHDIALGWTIALSIILHAFAIVMLPSVHIEKEPPEPELVIELAPIKKAEPPQPIELPKPEAKPEPVKQEQKLKPEPIQPKVIPSPEPVVKSKPTATEAPPPQPAPELTAPPVIAVAPKAETPPVVTAPPPPPPEPVKTGPSPADIDEAKNQYGIALARELAKHKLYPKIAQMRGWEGEVILELQLDSNGNVVSSKVHTTSTFDALDKQALEMAKKASFPPPPEALRGRSFNILVPVSFKLE